MTAAHDVPVQIDAFSSDMRHLIATYRDARGPGGLPAFPEATRHIPDQAAHPRDRGVREAPMESGCVLGP